MDEQDAVQEAEEILHVFHHPDATVYVVETKQPPIVDSTGLAPLSVPPARSVLLVAICCALLPVASILFQVFLFLHPPIATILIQAQQIAVLAHIYQLPPVTLQNSLTVTTSGHKHIAATQGWGVVTFYNGLPQQQTIAAGELLTGNDGEEVVTDYDVTIPAGSLSTNGAASVLAHALDYGPAGNIQAGDIYGPCCRAWIKVVNSTFTGGHAARDYAVVTKADIDAATASLLAQENAMLDYRISADETLLTPVPCTTHTASNHRAGDIAQQVIVTVKESCSPSAYKPRDVQHSLIALVAGKTKQAALSALLRLSGVSSVAINWPDSMKLPPAPYIHLDVLTSG
jgi:hypothetical protein